MSESPWVEIWDKRSLRTWNAKLQAFTATDDRPKWGSRDLPHPKPWEWEAQRHVRALLNQYQAGDLVLLRLGDHSEIWGVHHIRFKSSGTRMVVKLEVIAVARDQRGPTPPHLGDELYDHALELLSEKIPPATTEVLLAASIHSANRASERWAKRHGFEPATEPTRDDISYVRWVRPLRSQV